MQNPDPRFKEMATKIAGRRRGQLYRSEMDWFAAPGIEKSPKQAMKEMQSQLKSIRRLDSTMTNDGWTGNRMFKKTGSIPFYIYLAHPELWYDIKALERFYKDNPKWAVGG